MIETAEQLYQAIEQMGRMQRILESYRNEILTKHPRNFALLVEGPLEQLRQLQKQIDEYIQHLKAAGIGAWLSNLAFLPCAINLHFGTRNSTLWLDENSLILGYSKRVRGVN